MNGQNNLPAVKHDVAIKGRKHIDITGVREVVSFDETNVRLITSSGILNLEGEGLRIHVLNTADGAVAVTGKLNGVLYEDEAIPAQPTGKPRSRRFFGL